MRINWEWFGGFFDGEGCVSCYSNPARQRCMGEIVATCSQSGERGRTLLAQIQEFLKSEGIKSYIHCSHAENRNPKHQISWKITITSRPNLMTFLRCIRPYVFMKQVVVEDTLRFLIAFPTIRGLYFKNENPANQTRVQVDREAIKRDRATGMSLVALAKKYGTCDTTIWRIVNGVSRSKRELQESSTVN